MLALNTIGPYPRNRKQVKKSKACLKNKLKNINKYEKKFNITVLQIMSAIQTLKFSIARRHNEK